MKRQVALEAIKNHPWLSRLYKSLTAQEADILDQFIVQNDSADQHVFQERINRMHLNNARTKNWAKIEELLSSINTDINWEMLNQKQDKK